MDGKERKELSPGTSRSEKQPQGMKKQWPRSQEENQ
jgi:hypothetical protein